MKIQIPDKANKILEILNLHNYDGYVVGGCVRDSILGRKPRDWDICTNCRPEKMMEIFKSFKVIPTGLKHGTLTVVIDEEQFEITTYRIEEAYTDGRHPEKVEFTNNLREDLKRRDFTINAIAYNPKDGLVDCFNGIDDISNKIIRCVGNPIERFGEDYLRMLRAVRFSGQLKYKLHSETFLAVKRLSNNIIKISKERIREELNKILLTEKPSDGIRLLNDTGLLKYIMPELEKCVNFKQMNPHHDKDVFEHTMYVLDNTGEDLVIRLSALMHDIAKPLCFSIDEKEIGHFYSHHMKGMDIAEDILRRLKYDNKTIEAVKILVKEHMARYDKVNPRIIKRLINRVGLENIERLFELQMADIIGGKAPHDFSSIEKAKELYLKIITENQPLSVKDLEINGYDLIKIGIPKGKEIGIILNALLDEVLENPELNKKEVLISEAKLIFAKL